ncbi:hypothetical protein [Thiocapsa bogorovii]|uniref:hypothetical protein n=1 Tax=Thiocapsa bogorovii TaxID=521689 RepID=UPI001E2AE46D|nr:hypothetical protein [Thiocapsa bogorovii]UHD16871.1 hypothetical protein LT988_02050 [Thiocapsa bogorovii]
MGRPRILHYVDLMVDVDELGFKNGGGAGDAGQPAYDPANLLKLDLYGDEIVGAC